MKAVQQIIRIGEWDICPGTYQIKNQRKSIFVKPRLMRLLVFLIEHPNHIVTKAELMESVWEERIVTENLLTKSISELRQVVQDNFPNLMEIETIRSVGYKLRCTVQPKLLKEDRNALLPKKLWLQKGFMKRRQGSLIALGALAFLLLLASFFWEKHFE